MYYYNLPTFFTLLFEECEEIENSPFVMLKGRFHVRVAMK
jgi:hypothetical protein